MSNSNVVDLRERRDRSLSASGRFLASTRETLSVGQRVSEPFGGCASHFDAFCPNRRSAIESLPTRTSSSTALGFLTRVADRFFGMSHETRVGRLQKRACTRNFFLAPQATRIPKPSVIWSNTWEKC
jgi:hypothetical protein